jgi:hypothetical protein
MVIEPPLFIIIFSSHLDCSSRKFNYEKRRGFLNFYCFTFGFFEIGSCHVAQADLELAILLPQPPKYWDYRCDSLHLAEGHFIKFTETCCNSPMCSVWTTVRGVKQQYSQLRDHYLIT